MPDHQPLDNFFSLLGDFWQFKAKALSLELEIRVHRHVNIGIDTGNLDYPHYVWEEQALHDLPMGIFEAAPCYGKRIVTLHIQPESDDTLSILISGNTWAYLPYIIFLCVFESLPPCNLALIWQVPLEA